MLVGVLGWDVGAQALLDEGQALGLTSDLLRVRTVESVGGALAPSLSDELAARLSATVLQVTGAGAGVSQSARDLRLRVARAS